jgi:hypothetical protein
VRLSFDSGTKVLKSHARSTYRLVTIDIASIADQAVAHAIMIDDAAADASIRAFARGLDARRSP